MRRLVTWFKGLFKEDVLIQMTDTQYPQYSFKVVRMRPYVGKLSVMHNGKAFFKTQVNILFNAQYGVDIADFNAWGEMAVVESDQHMSSLDARH